MGLRPTFNKSALASYMNENKEIIKRSLIRRAKYIGEKLIIEARTSKGYNDITGALKNSIGYVIVVDRKIVFSSESSVATQLGESEKQDIISKVVADLPAESVALVMVAGMGYAGAVEALGYNVLTSAENMSKNEFRRTLKSLVNNLNKSIKNADV